MPQSNELRVFISSTFRDLQEEREHLIKKIFPEIRSLCRQRGITFTEVDLRWGLTDEQLALGQVIRTCLDEVDQCRPYFIGITGDRYGFIPSYLDIQKDPQLLAQHPWIEDAAMDEMSITEMEAHYALLGVGSNGIDKPKAEKARFYFRRHRESFQDEVEENEELHRLEAYQTRIEASGVSVERFRDPVSLGEMIFDDLVRIIKRDFADVQPPTPLEEERSRHEAFSLSRRRAYIANPAYLKKLNDHAAGDGPPLVVYAESGSGKSSLFAYWSNQYRRIHPTIPIIEHYVGIGATATDHYAIIRHICMEINERFGREEEIPSEPAKLETALGQWLGYADHELSKRSERMVLILDGLNQLQGAALGLKWIPDVILPSIRLILSSTVEGTLVELQKRGWSRFGMQALTEAERETIVVRYLAEYHKSLNPEQIARIAGDYKCGHPLFLKTVLEELRLVGRHEELDAKIENYLEATGTEDLFQRVLERLEEDYNMRAVREVMVLLSASRSGLDERELSELSGLARLKIATMMAGLDYHLVRKEGRLTFFHDYLRRAVEKRYLVDEQKKRSAHLQIAEYFQKGVSASITKGDSVPVRMAGELAYQLHAGGAIDRLRDYLSTMEVFLALYDGETVYEVLGYWSGMVEGCDIDGIYRRSLEHWRVDDVGERSRGVSLVVDLLQRLGRWVGAIELQRERLALAVTHGNRNEEAASRRSLGWLLYLRGEYAESLEELSRALDLSTELGDRRGIAGAIGNMGVVYDSRGDHDRALESMERQLQISEELGDRRGIAIAIGNMSWVYSSRGDHDRALECMKRSLQISEELGDRRDIALAIGNMGVVYARRGEYDRALESLERQLRISEELGDRRGIAGAIGNMGVVYSSRGEYDRALESYERKLRISEELGDRSGIAWAIGNMGEVYSSRGEYGRALESLHRAAEEHRVIGVRAAVTGWLQGIASVLLEVVATVDEMPEYLPTYVPGATPETGYAMSIRRARKCAEECVEISDELSKQDTQFSSRVMLARIVAAEGNVEAAIEHLGAMLAEATEDEQRAECRYWLWKINGAEEDRTETLRLYTALYGSTPKYDYHKRIDELKASGEQT